MLKKEWHCTKKTMTSSMKNDMIYKQIVCVFGMSMILSRLIIFLIMGVFCTAVDMGPAFISITSDMFRNEVNGLIRR